jgi:D-serine deaminase-like pyridoxal phosphate-dependent protein
VNGALDIAWVRGVDLLRVPSPALLLSVEGVRENVRRMIAIARDPARLWPHVKTHKLAWIVQEQLTRGITRFKCATIAEAEMTAEAGAAEVLLALQPVGPNLERFFALQRRFPKTSFSTLADDAGALKALERSAAEAESPAAIMLDIDVGQQRTGVAPDESAVSLYQRIANSRWLRPAGLHAYDGHLHQSDARERTAASNEAFAPVDALQNRLAALGLPVPHVVVGGTPTFPMHAARDGVECSPGTCVLWDAGYAHGLPDLDFVTAAALLTRVVSKPAAHRICLDLGHKAVASEMPHPRVVFPDLPEAKPVAHNEEHLVLETAAAEGFCVGDELIGVPWHICPTVALHAEAVLIEYGRVARTEAVAARARRLTV